MGNNEDREQRPPIAFRLRQAFEYPFGLRWVPDNHLAAVYRDEMYDRLCGPGFFRINPLKEAVKREISLNPDFISTEVTGLPTKDGVQLGLEVALAYFFDPRQLPRERALVVVQWSRDVLRLIVHDFAKNVLLKIVPGYYTEQICRGEVLKQLQESLKAELETDMEILAISPTFSMILKVTTPPNLHDTFTDVVNRAVYTHDLPSFTPFQLSEARRRELYRVLKETSTFPIPYLDLSGDLITPPLGKVSESSPRQIRGTARAMRTASPTLGADEELPQDPNITPKSHLLLPTTPPSAESEAEDGEEPPQRPGISQKSHLWPPSE